MVGFGFRGTMFEFSRRRPNKYQIAFDNQSKTTTVTYLFVSGDSSMAFKALINFLLLPSLTGTVGRADGDSNN